MAEELKAEHAVGLEIALKAMLKHRVAKGGVHLDALALLEGMIEDARAKPSQGGEAVEVVAVAFITRAEKSGPKIAITLKKEDAEKQHKNWLSMSKIITTEPLMTVAQHQRILAASVGSAEPVAMKTHGAWDGLDDLANLPDGTKLYTHPADQVAELVELLRDARTSVVGSSSTSAWFGDLLARIDAALAKSEGVKT